MESERAELLFIRASWLAWFAHMKAYLSNFARQSFKRVYSVSSTEGEQQF